jgi:hypothetical protein
VDGLTTVVVVHETATPDIRCLVALCAAHERILERASWARVDELVGFSSIMDCEACALIPETTPTEQPHHAASHARRSHLHPVARQDTEARGVSHAQLPERLLGDLGPTPPVSRA